MIRFATLADFDRIMAMMENFANASPLEQYHNPNYDDRAIRNRLVRITQNGCIIVGEDSDGEIQGMIIAVIEQDLWLPEIRVLREVAWWVEPEYRGTTLGYRLIKEYMRVVDLLKKKDLISYATLATLPDSPLNNMERWGWRNIQQHYALGEK